MERRHVFGGGIALTGVLLTVIQLVQGVQQLDSYEGQARGIVFTFETVPFVLVGLALTYVGYWLTRQAEYEADFPRIAAWGVGSSLLFASVAALIIFSQQVKPHVDILPQAQFIAMNHITIGAVIGVLVGLYDAQNRATQRELRSERDRVEHFANKAMDINTYGRELNRSDSVDAVSALCIQSLQGFLGLSETAFVIVTDDESELVDNTVVNVPDSVLADLARDSREQEQATVVRHESVPAEIESRAENAISILVTDHEDSSVVLLALTDEGTVFDEEDIQLLELLITHAATALDHLFHAAATDET